MRHAVPPLIRDFLVVAPIEAIRNPYPWHGSAMRTRERSDCSRTAVTESGLATVGADQDGAAANAEAQQLIALEFRQGQFEH
jgi:hypothetical protein